MAATKEIFTLLSLPTATTVVAMAAPKILTMLQTILQNVQMVGEELDEATHKCMQQHAEQLGQEMTRLLHELEQSGFAWRALLFAPLQHWQFWTVAGVLLLLFGLCWWLRRRSYEPDRRRAEQSCSSNTQEEVEVHEVDSEDALGRSFAKRIPWPVQNLAYRSRVMEELAGDLLRVFHMYFSGSFFPVLQPVIRVGSTFEGWSPREEDARYRLLLPLQPPRGHAFRLELGTAGEMPAKDSRVRVALECICRRPELVDDTLCFLHHPEEELRENQAPSLLHTLCTGSYLDAQKTARWFQDTVRSAWGVVPLSRLYKMNLLPSSRSCKMQLISTSGRSLFAEIIFGVQLGVSDIFLSSQPAEPGLIPSTRWPQSCVVAEAKFFRVVARQAPRDSFHLKCLQICARILEGTAFSTYTFKTAVMHLLTTTPLSDWRRRHFMLRLEDIMRYLDDCLKEKRLNHFFFGNEHVPEEIILPPAFPTAEPPNLFQHLAQDPAAHARAMTEFDELQNRLTSLLFYGR
ncbi:inositol 1,4,5-trisphosphate receptor-interacting protein-like 1 [Rhynochetos jubatus]